MKRAIIICLICVTLVCCFVGCSRQEDPEQIVIIDADNLHDEAIAVVGISKEITLQQIVTSYSSKIYFPCMVLNSELDIVKDRINLLFERICESKYTVEEYREAVGDENACVFAFWPQNPMNNHGLFQIVINYGEHTIVLKFYEDKLAISNTVNVEYYTLNQSSDDIRDKLIELTKEK